MFKKATKAQSRLRCAIFGASGSGKTFSALRIAKGIGGPIALIDTERKTASKYADRFDFDVCDLDDRTIPGYIAAIKGAGEYPVLIIDSLTHAWQELLEHVDKLAQAKYRGNRFAAWAEGTPEQRGLVDALLSFPGHIIATMRSKTEWVIEENEKGKKEPRRVGLAPEQGKGIEYEFDLLLEITPDHYGRVLKDRTGKFQDAVIQLPGEEFGQQLAAWLADGEPIPEPVKRTEWQQECANKVGALKAINHPDFVSKAKVLAHLKRWAASRELFIEINGLSSLDEAQLEQYAHSLTDILAVNQDAHAATGD